MRSDAIREHAREPAPVLIRGLLPRAEPHAAAELVQRLGLWERAGAAPPRPLVLLNMVSTVDGRATVDGHSGAISSPADRDLFHALRAAVDAVLVGAGTVRTERYGRIITDPARRALRVQRGLSPEPLACIVSASLALDSDIPLLAERESRVVFLTPSQGELAPVGAQVQYVRREADGRLDLGAALAELATRFGIGMLLCEGGPHLAGDLLAAGLLDELFLTVSPALVGTISGPGRELRVVAGAELSPPVELELLDVLEHGSHLFLHYRVAGSERVSRETIPSSSLAR
ncbi:MAG TPA: dihydrofolate reductase family protein [Solirubrobacteraceae bacterium]|nr:dihydrofolate reductase family protein [Solirubrobacteraceae bacterium]